MNKIILLGSIIAVVILVLVSFTGVVGYQTTKSSTIARASPLFSVRTSRAIDEESKDLSCDYVGKNNEMFYKFPKIRQDKNKIKIISIIERISVMNDDDFEELCKKITYERINHMGFLGTYRRELINLIKKLRNNPELCITYLNEKRDNDFKLNVVKFNPETLLFGDYLLLFILLVALLIVYPYYVGAVCVQLLGQQTYGPCTFIR